MSIKTNFHESSGTNLRTEMETFRNVTKILRWVTLTIVVNAELSIPFFGMCDDFITFCNLFLLISTEWDLSDFHNGSFQYSITKTAAEETLSGAKMKFVYPFLSSPSLYILEAYCKYGLPIALFVFFLLFSIVTYCVNS